MYFRKPVKWDSASSPHIIIAPAIAIQLIPNSTIRILGGESDMIQTVRDAIVKCKKGRWTVKSQKKVKLVKIPRLLPNPPHTCIKMKLTQKITGNSTDTKSSAGPWNSKDEYYVGAIATLQSIIEALYTHHN